MYFVTIQAFLVVIVSGRPDEINGQLAGYNYVFGLQLFNPFEDYFGIDFGRCVRECNNITECVSMSYLKG